MAVQTDYGRSIEALVVDEFRQAGLGHALRTVDEPAEGTYIEVTFEVEGRLIRFKLDEELGQPNGDIRAAVRGHIEFARRRPKPGTIKPQ